ncbi:MAG: hypothetical protein HY698_02550 [Deltaproteobacteria bacterium]|nr:hypothetical protein [Deltaproteobacteria bacterium]
MIWSLARVLGFSCLVGTACQRAQEVNGVGPYIIGKTMLADGQAAGRCIPSGEITHCFGMEDINLGDKPAQVGLYFAGKDPGARLMEVAMSVRSCDFESVTRALERALGTPTERRTKRHLWTRKLIFVSAALSERTCEVSFVDSKDQARITELKAGP